MWTIPPYSLHFYSVAAVSGLSNKALCVCVRYKRKGLNQVGHSLVHDQKQQQQQQHSTQQQHDLHWNEHHEQSKISVFIISLLLIRLTDNLHKHGGLKFIPTGKSEAYHSN